ncbi:uncharacterized protein LOC130725575 [Lotus japonicus]|uniref:uncharacterized protein LOC130725575 n=1 Tax=Lotus japonicus TaxID=34305 RepID=UPI002583A6B8|nr:uncharacterized protein LOC130725575 [Lotus japonicus]
MREKGKLRERESGGEGGRFRQEESEDGWVRVKGGRRKNTNRKLRDEEITSYFFTNFPNHFNAKNMWEVFSHWGRVQEVVIPVKRDRKGNRFGFVRFFDVINPTRFGRRLDQIFIGSTKLYVNLPRFRNHAEESNKRACNEPKTLGAGTRSAPSGPSKTNLASTNGISSQKSYVAAVSTGRNRGDAPPKGDGKIKEVVAQLSVEDEVDDWLKKSWVGKLKNIEMAQNIQETLLVGGFHSIRARYLGDDLVLLSGDPGVSWDEISKGTEDWLCNLFESITPWSPSLTLKSRLVWVQCYGIPLHPWKKKSFEQLFSPIGKVIELDVSTSELTRLGFARLKICTTKLETISDA